MPVLTNSRHEIFAQNWFKGETKEKSAIIAGYKPSRASQTASRLVKKGNILARYNELQQKAEDETVATVLQRRQVASKVTLATIADFVDEYGNLNITDKSQLDTPAVQELKTVRTSKGGIRTTLKLRDQLAGADLLNKMDRLYSDMPPAYNDNRVINFVLSEGQSLIEGISKRLTEGTIEDG